MADKQDARSKIEAEIERISRNMITIMDEQDRLERQREALNAEIIGLNFALGLLPEAPKRGRPANGAAEKPAVPRKRSRRAPGANAAADTMDAAERAGLIPRTAAQEERE